MCQHNFILKHKRLNTLRRYEVELWRCDLCGYIEQRALGITPCAHPNSYYDGEEESVNCKKQKIVRDRWKCPDCKAVWYEGMRVWDDRLQRYVSPQ